MAWLRARLLLLLLLAAPSVTKRRKRSSVPAVPKAYDEEGSCPFHRDGGTPKELSDFGHELERDGRQPEAVRCYAAAIRTNRSDATGWFDLAVAHQYSEPALALRLYRHGVSLQPTAFHYNQLGVMLRERAKQDVERNATLHADAARSFRLAHRLSAADASLGADALFNLGGSHEMLEQHKEALSAYRGALAIERKNEARIQNNIGNVLGRLGRWQDALAAYHEAEEADPDFPETHANLASVLMGAGMYEEAERHLKAARRLTPDQEEAHRARHEEWADKMRKAEEGRRRSQRRAKYELRDGHMTREERTRRFQEVVGRCGMGTPGAKECMKAALGQEDIDEEQGDMIMF